MFHLAIIYPVGNLLGQILTVSTRRLASQNITKSARKGEAKVAASASPWTGGFGGFGWSNMLRKKNMQHMDWFSGTGNMIFVEHSPSWVPMICPVNMLKPFVSRVCNLAYPLAVRLSRSLLHQYSKLPQWIGAWKHQSHVANEYSSQKNTYFLW